MRVCPEITLQETTTKNKKTPSVSLANCWRPASFSQTCDLPGTAGSPKDPAQPAEPPPASRGETTGSKTCVWTVKIHEIMDEFEVLVN